jgi:hypothetical protein
MPSTPPVGPSASGCPDEVVIAYAGNTGRPLDSDGRKTIDIEYPAAVGHYMLVLSNPRMLDKLSLWVRQIGASALRLVSCGVLLDQYRPFCDLPFGADGFTLHGPSDDYAVPWSAVNKVS